VDVQTTGGSGTIADWSVTLESVAQDVAPSDLLQDGATDGQGVVWNDSAGQYEPQDVLQNLSEDTSPQLGGTLDAQGNEIQDGEFRGHREPVLDHGTIDAADTDAVATTQTIGSGGGDLTLDGAKVSGGTATFTSPRLVTITSTNDLSGVTVTVEGTDKDGNSQSETLSGPNNTTVSTANYYLTVTRVAADAAASGISAGQGDASLLIDLGYGVQTVEIGAAITAIFTVGSSGSANWSTVLRLTNGASYGWPSSPSGINTPGGSALADLVTSTSSTVEDEWIIQTPDAGTTVFIASGPQEYQAAL
jgi:hypothetical protein